MYEYFMMIILFVLCPMERIPADRQQRRDWLRAVGRSSWDPSKHTYICSEHFEASCYLPAHDGRPKAMLKPDAVPTVFSGKPASRAAGEAARQLIKVHNISTHLMPRSPPRPCWILSSFER